jgi:hypothetical protein
MVPAIRGERPGGIPRGNANEVVGDGLQKVIEGLPTVEAMAATVQPASCRVIRARY